MLSELHSVPIHLALVTVVEFQGQCPSHQGTAESSYLLTDSGVYVKQATQEIQCQVRDMIMYRVSRQVLWPGVPQAWPRVLESCFHVEFAYAEGSAVKPRGQSKFTFPIPQFSIILSESDA